MFPRLRQQLLARADLVVELATLGEYGIDEHGGVLALDPEPPSSPLAPRIRDRCGSAGAGARVTASGCAAPARS